MLSVFDPSYPYTYLCPYEIYWYRMKRPLADRRPIGPFITSTPGDPTERLVGELESMIEDEESAKEEYARVIKMLEDNGYNDMADQVRSIRDDEIRHSKEFRNMVSQIRRETSY